MAATISATDTEVQKPINAVFQQQFLRQATPLCVYLTWTKPTALAKSAGASTAKWRRVGTISPSVTALAEQTTTAAFFGGRDAATTSNTDVTATLAKYGQTVILTEEAEMFNPREQKAEIIKSLAIAGGRSLNQLQRDIVDDGATVVYVVGVASTGAIVSKITINSIDNVVNTLSLNVATPFTPMANGSTNIGTSPVLPAFWGMCHPNVAYDIKNLPGFKSVETYGGHTRTVPGEFGMVQSAGYAVRFLQSPDATADANAGGALGSTGLRSTGGSQIDVYTTAIFGQDALGSVGLGVRHTDGSFTAQGMDSLPASIEIIEKGLGSGGTSDPFNEIQTIAYKFWHAGAVLNTNWVRVIKSGATSLSS